MTVQLWVYKEKATLNNRIIDLEQFLFSTSHDLDSRTVPDIVPCQNLGDQRTLSEVNWGILLISQQTHQIPGVSGETLKIL